MTVSYGEIRSSSAPAAGRSATIESRQTGTNLVGWLIQIAIASVLEEMCETFADPRGFTNRRIPQIAARLGFSLNSTQSSLIAKVWQRKYKTSASRVAPWHRNRG